MELAGYVSLICVGMALSLIGGGGSLLSVPILVYLFSLDTVTASSYSLFIVGTTSLLGVLLKQKEQHLDIRAGIAFCLSSIVATFTTRKWLVPVLPEQLLIGDDIHFSKRALMLGIFALLVIASSIMILRKRSWATSKPGGQRLKILIPVSFIIGVLGGFVGVGGGFLILPSLIIFAGLSFKIAIGTTLFVIGLNSLMGFLGDIMNYHINWVFLLLVTSLSAVGMVVGHLYSGRIPVYFLRMSFAWIMLCAAIVILVKELLL